MRSKYGSLEEATPVLIYVKPGTQKKIEEIATEVLATVNDVYNEMLEYGIDAFLYGE